MGNKGKVRRLVPLLLWATVLGIASFCSGQATSVYRELYGGVDERAIILGERLRQVIAESPITVSDDLQIRITLSVGIAVFPDHAQNESELIGAADAALYKAKQMGRNRVCMFEPELVKGGGKNVRV